MILFARAFSARPPLVVGQLRRLDMWLDCICSWRCHGRHSGNRTRRIHWLIHQARGPAGRGLCVDSVAIDWMPLPLTWPLAYASCKRRSPKDEVVVQRPQATSALNIALAHHGHWASGIGYRTLYVSVAQKPAVWLRAASTSGSGGVAAQGAVLKMKRKYFRVNINKSAYEMGIHNGSHKSAFIRHRNQNTVTSLKGQLTTYFSFNTKPTEIQIQFPIGQKSEQLSMREFDIIFWWPLKERLAIAQIFSRWARRANKQTSFASVGITKIDGGWKWIKLALTWPRILNSPFTSGRSLWGMYLKLKLTLNLSQDWQSWDFVNFNLLYTYCTV